MATGAAHITAANACLFPAGACVLLLLFETGPAAAADAAAAAVAAAAAAAAAPPAPHAPALAHEQVCL